MFKPKFDYDDQDFYDALRELASRGYTDAEIAYGLEDLAGQQRSSLPGDVWPDLPRLTPTTFGRMKNGKYSGWTDEENKSRSEKICRVLARERDKINVAVRGQFLQMALGKAMTKSKVYRYVRKKCECAGKDKGCPSCHGTGWYPDTERQLIMEHEQTCAPAPQMLATWLHHHDSEWRHRDMMRHEENAGKDNEVTGIDIQVVYNDKKDLELQEKGAGDEVAG
jgi:hypothetical protein